VIRFTNIITKAV